MVPLAAAGRFIAGFLATVFGAAEDLAFVFGLAEDLAFGLAVAALASLESSVTSCTGIWEKLNYTGDRKYLEELHNPAIED